MNKEFEEVKRVYKEIKRNKDIIGSIEKDFFFNFGDLVIKELERLQEENKKMQTDISEHVYWESTPTTELKKLFVSKGKIREKLNFSGICKQIYKRIYNIKFRR